MSTTTPPATDTDTRTTGPERRPVRTSARVIAILAIVGGGALVLGTVLTSVVGSIRSAVSSHSVTLTAPVDGVRELDVTLAAGDLVIETGAVEEATLEVRGPRADDWRLEREGDELSVARARSWWDGWGVSGARGERAVLVLPEATGALDADLHVEAGALRADLDVGALDLDLDAGAIEVAGSVREVDADVAAGSIDLALSGVRSAEMDVRAGSVQGVLEGRAPSETDITVSAGRVELTLPDAAYRVESDVSVGSFENGLRTDADAPRTVRVQVEAGEVVLR